MASLRFNEVVGTFESLLCGRVWEQGKTRSDLTLGKGEVDVGQRCQERGQKHPEEADGLLC